MDELKLTGNCLKGSRPIIVFDQAFDETPHMKLIKEVLMHVSLWESRELTAVAEVMHLNPSPDLRRT